MRRSILADQKEIFFFVCLLTCVILYYLSWHLNYYNVSLSQMSGLFLVNSQNNATANQSAKCSPVNTSYRPYQVTLDGVTYPTQLQFHMNRSLNFDCLNSSSDIKTILFWNKFFGFEGYMYGKGRRSPFLANKV
jgi:hypothetical protein